MSTASPMAWRCEWSADSKLTITSDCTPSRPAARPASAGSRMRQLAGHSLAWTIWRTASVPDSHVGNTMPAVARNVGRRLDPHPRLGDHAEDALAADDHPVGRRARRPSPGRRRLSHQPCGVSIRTDSTKSSMWVWLVA